jgi:hypothetical protein
LILTQGGSGGYTITWPSSVSWGSAGTPTLSTTVGQTDVITLMSYNGKWLGFLSGKSFT